MKILCIIGILLIKCLYGMEINHPTDSGLREYPTDREATQVNAQGPLTFDILKANLPKQIKCLFYFYNRVGKEDSDFINPDRYFDEDLHEAFCYFLDPTYRKDFFVKDLNWEQLIKKYRKIVGAQYDWLGTGEAIIKNWADKKIQELIVHYEPNMFLDEELKEVFTIMKKKPNKVREFRGIIWRARKKINSVENISEELECFFFLHSLSHTIMILNDSFFDTYQTYLEKKPNQDDVSNKTFAREMSDYIKRKKRYAPQFDYIVDIIEKNKLYE